MAIAAEGIGFAEVRGMLGQAARSGHAAALKALKGAGVKTPSGGAAGLRRRPAFTAFRRRRARQGPWRGAPPHAAGAGHTGAGAATSAGAPGAASARRRAAPGAAPAAAAPGRLRCRSSAALLQPRGAPGAAPADAAQAGGVCSGGAAPAAALLRRRRHRTPPSARARTPAAADAPLRAPVQRLRHQPPQARRLPPRVPRRPPEAAAWPPRWTPANLPAPVARAGALAA